MDFTQMLIDELRTHGGQVTTGPMAGRPLMILTTKGAKSGEDRVAVVTYTRDGDRYVDERPEFREYPKITDRVIPMILLDWID